VQDILPSEVLSPEASVRRLELLKADNVWFRFAGQLSRFVKSAVDVALSHLARRGYVAASSRLAKPLNLLNLSPAGRQVMSRKNG
jgi:hypothetical protein